MLRVLTRSTLLRLGLVALVAALGFVAGNFFPARATPTPTTFYACLNTRTSTLFNVSTTSQRFCGSGAVAVSWNQSGLQGPPGQPGANGTSIRSGSGAPSDAVGNDGDFYLDTQAEVLYGPKANGSWPASGTSLVGPQGPIGPAGTVVASSCNAGDVVTSVGDDGKVQCTDPGSDTFRCVISNPYPGQNLAGCNLTGADLSSATLVGANLTHVELDSADLTNAELGYTVLTGADLSSATLVGAALTRSDLIDANLTSADLTNASLFGALTDRANVTGVTWSNTVCPDGRNSGTGAGATCVGKGF